MQILIILLIVLGFIVIGSRFLNKKDEPAQEPAPEVKEEYPVVVKATVPPTSGPSVLGSVEKPKSIKKEKAPKKEKSISKEGGAKRGRKPKSKGDDLLLS